MLVERAVDLRVGDRFAADDVHDARGDADAIAVALEAADHGQPDPQRRGDVVQRSRRVRRTASITRQRSTTRNGRAPRRSALTVSAMPADSHAAFGSPVTLVKSRTAIARAVVSAPSRSSGRRTPAAFASGGGAGCGAEAIALDDADEPIAAARDGLDVLRIAGVVAERLPQLGHRLRQRVVGDVGAGPERVEQLLLRDQRAGVIEQEEQQVEELRRQVHGPGVAKNPIASSVHDKRAKAVGGFRHARGLYAVLA